MAFYRTRPAIDRFMEKVVPVTESGCWLWVGAAKPTGYGNFYMGGGHINAHRASLILHGRDPGADLVCHKCDTPCCVNPDHLFASSQKENLADMVRKGRANTKNRARGEHNHAAKLSAENVQAIRTSDEPTQALADRYGVTYQAIRSIRTRVTWKHAA